MPIYDVEIYGTITRDIRWFDVEAADEDEARRIVAQERPSYRINKITLASGYSDTTTPAPADGSPGKPTS